MKNYTIVFDDQIDFESVTKLIDRLDEHVLDNKMVHLYFSSCGGEIPFARILSDYLNRWQSHIKLSAYFLIGSCAFRVFYEFMGEKAILDQTMGLLHISSGNFNSRELLQNNSMSHLQNQMLKQTNQELIDLYHWLTPNEHDAIKNGEDVILSYNRLREIFSKTTKLI